MDENLTVRQKRTAARREAFCHHLLVTCNAAEAARRAGYASGKRARLMRSEGRKKDDGAKVVGCRLRADPAIRMRMAELFAAACADAIWLSHRAQHVRDADDTSPLSPLPPTVA